MCGCGYIRVLTFEEEEDKNGQAGNKIKEADEGGKKQGERWEKV